MLQRSLRNLSLSLLAIGVAAGAVSMWSLGAGTNWPSRINLGLMNIVYWGVWAGLIPVAVRVAGWIRRRTWHRAARMGAHVVAACACALVHVSLLAFFRVAFASALAGRQFAWRRVLAGILATERFAVEWELTMYAGIAVFAYAAALYAEAQRRDVEVARLEAGIAEARLLSLQRQLQPHFLFNTLHAVSSLIRREPATAEAMIERLGQLLRTSLRSGAAAEGRLSDDLAALDDYLAIESAQMRERLSVVMRIDPDVLGAAVPVLFLQPLVENAVRHGLQPRAGGGTVSVSATRVLDDLVIEIVDDGVGLRGVPDDQAGVGLGNTRNRLQQLYGDRHRFSVANAPGGGVAVCARIPFRPASVPDQPYGAGMRRAS